MDQILVVEVATTCWPGAAPAGQRKEIIEIAVHPLDIQMGRPMEGRSILVRPTRSVMGTYCESVTGLNREEVSQGCLLTEACEILVGEFKARERIWASYGNTPRRRFKKDCKDRKARYPFGPSHINIKSLIAVMRALRKEYSLPEVLRLLNQTSGSATGKAMSQSHNAALLLGRLLLEARVKYVVGVN